MIWPCSIVVLELRPPELPTFKALLVALAQMAKPCVSYLFIAIVWTNHHYLMRYATEATPRQLWFNFAHLFSSHGSFSGLVLIVTLHLVTVAQRSAMRFTI